MSPKSDIQLANLATIYKTDQNTVMDTNKKHHRITYFHFVYNKWMKHLGLFTFTVKAPLLSPTLVIFMQSKKTAFNQFFNSKKKGDFNGK